MMRSLIRRSPAKINLGLEILGRRDDGFHEIRSIMARITLADELEFTVSPYSTGSLASIPPDTGIDPEVNLVNRAIALFNQQTGLQLRPDVTLRKSIPIASGLGGASSNAAATLSAMNNLAGTALADQDLHGLAEHLGSDVPFFLDASPIARVSGRGTEIESLPPVHCFLVVVTAPIRIPAKTATLYRALDHSDFSSGAMIEKQVSHIRQTGSLDPSLLDNCFLRPLQQIAPEISGVIASMQMAGCQHVALSGARPSLYTLFDSAGDATRVSERLVQRLPAGTFICTTAIEVPQAMRREDH